MTTATAPDVDPAAWARGLQQAAAGRRLALRELTDLVDDLEAKGDGHDLAHLNDGRYFLERLTGIEVQEVTGGLW